MAAEDTDVRYACILPRHTILDERYGHVRSHLLRLNDRHERHQRRVSQSKGRQDYGPFRYRRHKHVFTDQRSHACIIVLRKVPAKHQLRRQIPLRRFRQRHSLRHSRVLLFLTNNYRWLFMKYYMESPNIFLQACL